MGHIWNHAFERILEIVSSRWVFVINFYEGYFDESGTHDPSPFTCVGGFLFKKSEAIIFKKYWFREVKTLLPKGADAFHARNCFHRTNKFAGISIEQSEAIFDAMINLINETARYGIIIGIERKDYDLAFTGSNIKMKSFVGSPYALCAMLCAESVGMWLSDKKRKGGVSYFFEESNFKGEATHFLCNINSNLQLKDRYHIHSFSIIPKTDGIPLQAAELLVWEIQRAHITATKEKNRQWRKTLSKLTKVPLEMGILTDTGAIAHSIENAFYGIRDK